MNKKKGFRRITILLSIFSGVVGWGLGVTKWSVTYTYPYDRSVLYRDVDINWVGVIAAAAIGVALPWLVYFVVRWIFRGFTASESIEKLKGGNK